MNESLVMFFFSWLEKQIKIKCFIWNKLEMKRNNELKEIVYIICLVTFVDNHPENETSIFFLYIYISYSLSLILIQVF